MEPIGNVGYMTTSKTNTKKQVDEFDLDDYKTPTPPATRFTTKKFTSHTTTLYNKEDEFDMDYYKTTTPPATTRSTTTPWYWKLTSTSHKTSNDKKEDGFDLEYYESETHYI
ncbi:uncharacterized protein LOC144425890 [Styela clava]